MTNDVDVAIFGPEPSEKTAVETIRSFGMESRSLRKAQLQAGPSFAIKKKSTPVQIVAGRILFWGLSFPEVILPYVPSRLKKIVGK